MNALPTTDANITIFLTAAGLDLVLRRDNVQHRARAPYGTMSCELDGKLAVLDFTESDDTIVVTYDKVELQAKLQPKGHYFTWLKPIAKAKTVAIDEAKRLMREAMRAKAKKAA